MIFTFYSYKGGVGRSMALANVAHWLYLRGRSVVVVDWDLEAPGIENFFFRSEEQLERARAQLGVIDLLSSYRRQAPYVASNPVFNDLPALSGFVLNVVPEATYRHDLPADGGRLTLLTAGWRSGERFAEYAETVQSFDWTEFYSRHRGEDYFDWFRSQLLSLGDVVLVDSRTGVSEMSGVCTRQLADVVVVVCAPNAQNLRGTVDMVESFISPEVTKARARPLEVLILPARVDDADSKGHEEFREEFLTAVERFTPPVLREWKRSPWDLEIPYKAQYSYREGLVTGVLGANEKLEQAYRDLAAHMALLAGEGGPMWQACEPELKVLAARVGKELTDAAWLKAAAEVARLDDAELASARAVLLRLVRLSRQAPVLDTRRRAGIDEFQDAASILPRLESMGVVARVQEAPEEPEQFELAHEALVRNWDGLRQWVQEDRSFLLWRQEISDDALRWRDSGNDSAHLLRGKTLLGVETWKSRLGELDAAEQAFLHASEQLTESEQAEAERLKAETEATTHAYEAAVRDVRRAEESTIAAEWLAAILFLMMAGSLILLSGFAAAEAELGDRAVESRRIRDVREQLEEQVAAADAFDKAVSQSPRLEGAPPGYSLSRRGLPLTRVARRQAERFRNLESLDRQESQGATTRVAVSAIAVNGLGLMLLWTLLRSRRRLAVHDDVIWRLEHTVSRMSSTASARLQQGSEQLRDRIESLSDPLGRLPRTGLAALSAASVACILALLITGMVMALGLWMHSLTLRAIFVEIVAGVAAGVWLAGRYALTSTGRAERSAARRAADG